MEQNIPLITVAANQDDDNSDLPNNFCYIDEESQISAIIRVPKSGQENVIEIKPATKNITIEELNKRTLEFYDKKHKRTIFVFDYSDLQICAKDLFKLTFNNEWEVLKHPLIFNYINEILLRCAFFYGIQLILNFVHLYFLCINVHEKLYSDEIILVITILGILFFGAMVKFYVQSKISKEEDKFVQIEDEYSKNENMFSSILIIFYMQYLFLNFIFIWLPIYSDNDKKILDDDEKASNPFPIIFIILSWIQCLYVLRLSPCGIHIAMLAAMFKSFLKLSVILVSTTVCFTFCFQLVMKGSKVYPWDDSVFLSNITSIEMLTFQSFIKITAMMTGELEASNFLQREFGIATLTLLVFEIIAVILLMNLMISLALRETAEETMFSLKTRYCIEALYALEYCFFLRWLKWDLKSINNIIVIPQNEKMEFSKHLDTWLFASDSKKLPLKRIEFTPLSSYNENTTLSITNTTVNLHFADRKIENANEEFIKYLSRTKDNEICKKYVRWLIGLKGKLLTTKKVAFCKHCGHSLES